VFVFSVVVVAHRMRVRPSVSRASFAPFKKCSVTKHINTVINTIDTRARALALSRATVPF